MHLLTRESARTANACYTDERIAEIVPPEGLTPAQIAALPIPAADLFWEREQREQVCRCARMALERERAAEREPDARSWKAVEVAERFARGEATDEELRAAYAAASDAAERLLQVRE